MGMVATKKRDRQEHQFHQQAHREEVKEEL
jgi:hypothetical protein